MRIDLQVKTGNTYVSGGHTISDPDTEHLIEHFGTEAAAARAVADAASMLLRGSGALAFTPPAPVAQAVDGKHDGKHEPDHAAKAKKGK